MSVELTILQLLEHKDTLRGERLIEDPILKVLEILSRCKHALVQRLDGLHSLKLVLLIVRKLEGNRQRHQKLTVVKLNHTKLKKKTRTKNRILFVS